MSREIIFLDVEATQVNAKSKKNYIKVDKLLQLGAVKYDLDTKQTQYFNQYCLYTGPLNPKIKHLLSKDSSFFRKQEKTEDIVYQEFTEFAKGITCFAYGNYDEVVLNSVKQNHNLTNEVILRDFQKEFIEEYSFEPNFSPSLKCLANVYEVNQTKQHDGLEDAITLYNIYMKIQNSKHDADWIRSHIFHELLRPRCDEKNKAKC